MYQEKKDQGWRDLELHINQLVGKYLPNHLTAIEYKPRHRTLLLSPPEYGMKDVKKKRIAGMKS